MKPFTVKDSSSGNIVWEGIIFSNGSVSVTPLGMDRVMPVAYETYGEFVGDMRPSTGYHIAIGEELA